MKDLYDTVDRSKAVFRRDIEQVAESGGITREMYTRYLTFQYHLTNGVQNHFLRIVAHPTLAGRRRLRDFLYKFALEEEPHYGVAESDLDNMGERPGALPFDVALWWSYFDKVVDERPFERLGATCVLENLGSGAGVLGRQLLDEADFLNNSNTRFLQIHFHEELPHGDQIYAALESVNLSDNELADLIRGAKYGSIMYLRMARWAFGLTMIEEELRIAEPLRVNG